MESGRMAVARTCCECNQPCFVGLENSCCPKGCKRCVLKKCKEQKKCKCNECNCGCQLEENKGKLCKDLGCPECVVLCKDVKAGDTCLCSKCTCGCEKAFEKGKLCCEKESNKCPECEKKCGKSIDGDCICYLCNCGCNGVNCQCCRWCNPVTACNGTCDRETKHSPKCTGKKEGEECGRDNVGKFYCMEHKDKDGCEIGKGCKLIFYATGGCRFKCTHCGKLCAQDICRIWLGVIIIVSLILSSLFVMRRMYPEKFHAMMTKIRAAFPNSPGHPGRSLSNLVGDSIPEDMNIDRHPAFRPRTYSGLA